MGECAREDEKTKNPEAPQSAKLAQIRLFFNECQHPEALFQTLFFPVYHKDNWLASHGSLQASFVLGHEIPGYRAQRGLLGRGGGGERRVSEKCVLSSRFADFLQCQEESSHAPVGEL